METPAAVLAAGRGSRFLGDVPKPLALLRGRPLIRWAVDAARASDVGPVAVVIGHASHDVVAALPAGVTAVRNDDWARGIATSVRTAVAWAREFSAATSVTMALADQPLLGAEAWQRVAHALPVDLPLVVATYGGRRGHPVRIGRPLFDEAMLLEGDEGARTLMRVHAALEVPCDGTGTPEDIDTVDDLAAVESALLYGPST